MNEDSILDALESNIGRIVAALTPILTAIVVAGAYWLQDVIGVDMQQHVEGLVAFLTLVGGSALAAAVTWLRNRGNWEKQVMETAALTQLGSEEALAAEARLESSGGVSNRSTGRVPQYDMLDSGPEEAAGNPGEDPTIPDRESGSR
jgi:hypothetical protein